MQSSNCLKIDLTKRFIVYENKKREYRLFCYVIITAQFNSGVQGAPFYSVVVWLSCNLQYLHL